MRRRNGAGMGSHETGAAVPVVMLPVDALDALSFRLSAASAAVVMVMASLRREQAAPALQDGLVDDGLGLVAHGAELGELGDGELSGAVGEGGLDLDPVSEEFVP